MPTYVIFKRFALGFRFVPEGLEAHENMADEKIDSTKQSISQLHKPRKFSSNAYDEMVLSRNCALLVDPTTTTTSF